MKKVLVIGATGMMGSHLVPLLLSKGYAVDGVTLDDAKSENENLRYIKTNATDETVLLELLKNDYDGVIDFLHYTNAEIFKKRSKMFLENTKHYIFLSSYRVYADNDGVINENSPRLTEAYANDKDLIVTIFTACKNACARIY